MLQPTTNSPMLPLRPHAYSPLTTFRFASSLFTASFFVAILFSELSFAQEKVSFNRDIRPILSDACFRCHGLDAGHRQADLRLDVFDGATAELPSGSRAIVPGSSEQSAILQRLRESDPELVMPPPTAKRQLSESEKVLIARWIDEGAPYQRHWSFEPIARPPVPSPESVAVEAWRAADIDRFLAVAMQKKGLEPQLPADRSTILRRVSFALTGLPPTLEEMDAFESDRQDGAYERMVDRYLESKAFGEEMARHWLDVARYGDTHGLHLDNDRQIWAYRDWVVNAFNDNMPFSQFTIEQLAGDLLPNATRSQLVATGFNRCNVTTSEGGAIDDEFLFRYAVDRTSTTIQTWLGLTGGCAVCHDHKYDPISMKEFYSMYSFFYSAADPAMDGNIENTQPFLALTSPDDEAELERLRKLVRDSKQALWEVARNEAAKPPANSHEVPPTGRWIDPWLDDDFPLAAGLRNTSRNAARWSTESEVSIRSGRRSLKQAFGDKYEQVVTGGLETKVIPVSPSFEAWIRLDPHEPPNAIFLEIRTDRGNKRWIWTDDPNQAKSVDSSPDRVVGGLPPRGVWSKLLIDQDRFDLPEGSSVQEWKIGLHGGIAWWDELRSLGTRPADNDPRRSLNDWWNSRKGKDTPLAEPSVNEAIKSGPESQIGQERSADVAAFFQSWIAIDPSDEVRSHRDAYARATALLACSESSIPGAMIFRDRPEPRQAHIMKRGQYTQPGDPVEPDTLSALPLLKRTSGATRATRLDLAHWLLEPDHPMTARVTVNRFWQQIFGVGIVKTSEDFGTQGQPPFHPELLDHMASRFRESGWNVKQLIRDMVCSQAFRQSSNITPISLERDPENRLLSRGPRLRLDAEQVRDNVLMVSGLLNRTMGGPGDRIYQPPKIWEPVGYGDSNTRYYLQDHGERLYRRSLYAYIKRTAPPPFLSNFDAPNREMSCSRRERSNTPLQALQLMNDVQHVEAARKLAERVLREGGDSISARRRFLFRVVNARYPDELESQTLDDLLQKFFDRFSASPDDAVELLRFGEAPVADFVNAIELASYTLLSNAVLNLDETVNRN